ncbi:DUF3800 domain-containing protein [Ottowia testudinis]|uniref:DUF3800 domain-containing protein n=1 Tax=Ottowia testudinis TaxID=2816950 RepID=A0A975CJB0_9BURK|nr:DUF3800 domain-containing protein [Ottowia testudinis]QTD45224.1 DUF3800 domain-containing protein [Ottowia testudinis]
MKETAAATAHYFVDESGDGVLFKKHGQLAIQQTEGVPTFMLGMLHLPNPAALLADLDALRAELLADPYFKNVPSMQASERKTALAFHAKDDVPEVRRAVFGVLLRHEMKFFAVVRDMRAVLAYVQERNRRDAAYRYKPNDLYDQTVSRLFKDRLHQHENNAITFARRGNSDRTKALRAALDRARQRFEEKWQTQVDTAVSLTSCRPSEAAGLQAVDYLLWALQRHYARGEGRFIEMMWPKVSLVHAVDETAQARYGVYYTKKKPLIGAAS